MFHLSQVLLSLLPLVAAILLVAIANSIFRSAFPSDNGAFGLRRAGFSLGLLIAMAAGLAGPSRGLGHDLWAVLVDGLMAIVMLAVAWFFNEYLILPTINNTRALAQGNRAVGIVEFASLTATGIIAYGSFTGTGGWPTVAVFFFLGQLALILAFWVSTWLTKADDLREIEKDNLAMAGYLSGTIIAISIVLGASVAGDFTSWASDIKAFTIDAVVGLASLLILGWIVQLGFSKVLSPSSPGAVYMAVAVKLGAAIMIAMAII